MQIRGGELYAVEEGGGAAGIERAAGEHVDYDGEGDLDRVVVLQRVEVDGVSGGAGGEGGRTASDGVALVVALVKVAEVLASEGWGLALAAVGLGVAA